VKRAPSFGRKQRSRLARRAATARWARLGRGVLTLAEIRAVVVEALGERKAKAYLFGSYARGDACAPTMKWRVGQEQISPWPPKEREADLAGEDYFGAAGNGLSQSTIRAQRRKS